MKGFKIILDENPKWLELINTENDQKLQLLQADVISRLCDGLNKQLENYLIEGLKRKGFEFENKFELESFVRQRCECIDNLEHKERIYSVDGKPFFLHRYEIIQQQITEENNGIKMTANYGSYAYL